MTITEAQEHVKAGGTYGEAFERIEEHNREVFRDWYLHCPDVPTPAAVARRLYALKADKPQVTGETCPKCGGFMMQTGSCKTCTICAESSGGCG